MNMTNMPEIKLGLVSVSRDCFPSDLARTRLNAVMESCTAKALPVVAAQTVVESEKDAMKAVREMRDAGVDALVIYLGNFGPEGPTTILARELGLPFMLCAAAEETASNLINGRGDAFCGMLNACLNAGLRNLRPHVPHMPVGLPAQIADMVDEFVGISRVVVGLKRLKVISFGPRPQDFYACNAPIKPLYDLGVEIMENSELDMFEQYKSVADATSEIDAIAADMAKELGDGNNHPEKLKQLAQFELALTRFADENKGASDYVVMANKCWPAFESTFGFVPCFVNSRLTGRGIPVACEVDIYGAVSEYMAQCASQSPVTILDINNTVPDDMNLPELSGATRQDLFMGFHCGNTPSSCLSCGYAMKFQLIMNRLMEDPADEPNITCGTLEGTLRPGATTLFRLQTTPDSASVMSYIAEGSVVDADPCSFGSIGIFAIPGFARFYRYALLARNYPHHAATAFSHVGETLYDALRLLGINDISTPKAAGDLYPGENPFRR